MQMISLTAPVEVCRMISVIIDYLLAIICRLSGNDDDDDDDQSRAARQQASVSMEQVALIPETDRGYVSGLCLHPGDILAAIRQSNGCF